MSRVTASAVFMALTLLGVSSAQTPVLGADVLIADASDMRRCRILGDCSRVSPSLRGQGRQFEHVSDATVCRKATGGNSDMVGNGEPYGWSRLEAGWVQEAQRRGLTCGVGNSDRFSVPANANRDNGNSPSTDDRKLCLNSTNVFLEWHPYWNEKEVLDAKARGLTPQCRISFGLPVSKEATPVAATTVSATDAQVGSLYRTFSDGGVCNIATSNGKWDTRSASRLALREARLRGLDCGVAAPNPIAVAEEKAEAERIAAIDPSDLCNKSVNSSDGEWDSRDEWKPYADEAKRRGLTCEDRKAEVRQQLAAAAAERDRKAEAKRQADLLELQTNPMSVALAEEVALSLPFEVSLVPQMNDLMLCVQGKFRKNETLTAEISKRGIRCEKLLELMR